MWRRGRRLPGWLRRTLIGWCVLLAMALVAGVTAYGALLAQDTGTISANARTMGDDGLWLGHAWVDGQHGQRDLDALVARLRTTGIRDLFVHTGPLSDNGSLNPALYPRARWLIAELHRALPGVRVQAWLGDIVGRGHMDLARPVTRAQIVASVRQVLALGYDGVQLDLEPISSGDPSYLAVLAQVHAATRPLGRVLSVAAAQVEPLPGAHLVADFWSAAYLHQVALRVDEVAIMSYGPGPPTTGAYSGLIRVETGVALRAVPPDVTLLMGVPAYRVSSVWPFDDAENVAAAIRGIRLAISPDPPHRPFGVALYVDFTATAQDWTSYLDDWVRLPERPVRLPGNPTARSGVM